MGYYEENPNIFDLTKIKIPDKKDKKGRYKICVHCKKKFYRKKFASKFEDYPEKYIDRMWEKKKYCTKSCREEYWSGIDKTMSKYCQLCGKKYYRPRKKAPSAWEGSKYCSDSCHKEAFHILKLSELMGLDFEKLKNYLIKIYKQEVN